LDFLLESKSDEERISLLELFHASDFNLTRKNGIHGCNELSDADKLGKGRGGWQTIISSAPQLNHLDQKPVFWDERLYAEAWSVVSAVNFKDDEHVIPVYLP
jgi:hypothetical protein